MNIPPANATKYAGMIPHGALPRGFALVSVLAIIALILVSLVALSTLLQTELRTSTVARNQELAQKNAILALEIAVGELQKHAGADRVATSSSAYLFGKSGLVAGTSDSPGDGIVRQKHWTGVWRPGNEGPIETGVQPDPQHVTWLVSGNEEISPSDPAAGASNPTQTSLYSRPNFDNANLEDGNVWMVGDGSVMEVEDKVQVPTVEIKGTRPGGAEAVVGKYAWWVADEGVKASIASVEPEVLATQTSPGTALYRNRLASPFGNLIGNPDLAGYDNRNTANRTEYQKIGAIDDLSLADSNWDSRDLFHSITPLSLGLLTDSRRGGLKRDLTAFLTDNQGPSNATSIIDPDEYGLTNSINLPRWGKIRSWYNLGSGLSGFNGGSTPIRAGDLETQANHPVIALYQLSFGLALDDTSPVNARQVMLLIYPKIVLWNPTDAPMAGGTYRVTATLDLGRSINVSFRRTQTNAASQANASPLRFDWSTLVPTLTFTIDCPPLPPGENRIFYLDDHTNSATTGQMQTDIDADSFIYLPTAQTVNATGLGASPVVRYKREEVGNLDFDYLFDPRQAAGQTHPFQMELLTSTGTTLQSFDGSKEIANAVRRTDATFPDIWRAVPRLSDLLSYSTTLNDLWLSGPSIFPRFLNGQLSGENARTSAGIYGTYNLLSPTIVRSPDDRAANATDAYPTLAYQASAISRKIHAENEPSEPASLPIVFTTNSLFGQGVRHPFFPIPRSDDDSLVSLGALRSVNFAHFHWQPPYAFGTSRPALHVPRERVSGRFGSNANSDNQYVDLTYMLNDNLWDGYFLSGMNYGGGNLSPLMPGNPSNDLVLPNASLKFLPDPSTGAYPSSADAADFESAAGHLAVQGRFNVNSVDVEAWKAALKARRNLSFRTQREGDIGGDVTPFSPTLYPIQGDSRSIPGVNPIRANSPQTHAGFPALNDAEIDRLAVEIVEEIKRRNQVRGPFLSLSEFVNRRLVTANNDPEGYGLSGTLQRAIDEVSDDESLKLLNYRFRFSFTESTAGPGNLIIFHAPPSTASAVLEAANDLPIPEHVTGRIADKPSHRSYALPGYLEQSKILDALSPWIATRSDTFKIRTYGEAINPATGALEAKAWGEAIVQRYPEYVDNSQPAETAFRALNPTNREFGRRFRVVSFRWLSPEEV